MAAVITIDGSIGEGGGQILRTALSLSAITKTNIALGKIRAGREKPGLRRQHLTCVRAVAEICGANVSGDEIGSQELVFAPGKIKAGNYRFDVGTAGSVTLVAQTTIPVLLMADGVSTVTITGGTHVLFAPIWEFFESCYLPELRRMGAKIEAKLGSYGFSPAAGGVVELRVWPFDSNRKLESYELTDLGVYRGGSVIGVVSAIPKSIAEAEVGIVLRQFPKLDLVPEVRTIDSFGPGNYCYAKLDYERASVVFSSVGAFDKSRKTVGNEVVQGVREFLKSGKACEKHLADQLLVPLVALTGRHCEDMFRVVWYDDWTLGIQKKTKHYETNKNIIQMFDIEDTISTKGIWE